MERENEGGVAGGELGSPEEGGPATFPTGPEVGMAGGWGSGEGLTGEGEGVLWGYA